MIKVYLGAEFSLEASLLKIAHDGQTNYYGQLIEKQIIMTISKAMIIYRHHVRDK